MLAGAGGGTGYRAGVRKSQKRKPRGLVSGSPFMGMSGEPPSLPHDLTAFNRGRAPPDGARYTQNAWLGHLRADRVAVTAYLISGVALRGRIAGFDSFCVLLAGGADETRPSLVYKHAIATLLPLQPTEPFEPVDL